MCQGTTLVVLQMAHSDFPALQAAEKLDPEGGGGFNPRIKPTESTRALAPEELFPPILPGTSLFPQPV
jgi:hypothetical protein